MADYEINLRTQSGAGLDNLSKFTSLKLSLAENNLSAATITLPSKYYPSSRFGPYYIVEIWSKVKGSPSKLVGDKVWFVTGLKDRISVKGEQIYEVFLHDANFVVVSPNGSCGRIVAYASGSAQADKSSVYADNAMKAVMRENLGSLATDTTRDISAYLTIQGDQSLAPQITKAFSRRNIFKVLQEIADQSLGLGTYLAFDIVYRSVSSGYGLEFCTYVNQRGIDHRWPDGYNPLILSAESGTLTDVEVFHDWSGEANYVYAGGQGSGATREVQTASDVPRINQSPIVGRREMWIDARNNAVAAGVLSEAQAALADGIPRLAFRAKFQESDFVKFGREFGFGDRITAEHQGALFDIRVSNLVMRITPNGESIDLTLSSR